MKNLIILISLCFLFSQCKHEDYAPDCDCSNLELVGDYGTQEGKIIFNPTWNTLGTYVIIPKNYFAGGVNSRYTLCTDSAFLKQIIDKQIKDSSQVVITNVKSLRVPSGYCNVFVKRTILYLNSTAPETPTIIRVKTIDKK